MWKTNKKNIKYFGALNEIHVIKRGFMRYAAVQHDGRIIAKGLKLKKYYNPYINGKPGSGALPGKIMRDCGHWDSKKGWVKGTERYELQLEDPKNLNHFDTVCVWR